MSGFFDAERSQGATASAQFGDGATAPPPSRCSGSAPWQETISAMGEPPQPLPPRDGADDAVPAPPVVAALPRDSELDDTVESSSPMTEQEERVNEGLGLGELCPAVNVTGSLGTTEQPVETPAPHDDDGEQTDVVEFTVPTMAQEERVNEGRDTGESRPAVAATCSPEGAEQPIEAALPRDGEQDVVVEFTVPTMEQEKERVNEGLDLDTEDSSEAVPPVETPAPHNDDGEQAAETVLPRDGEQDVVVGSTVPTMEQEKERVNEGLDLRESHPAVNSTSSPGAVPPVETPAPRDGDGGQDEAAVPSATAMEQEQGNLIDLMEQGEPQPALAAKVSPAAAEQPLETPTPHDGDIGGNDAARTTQPLRPLMTRKEMAEYLNVTEVTVTQLVRQGMPCIYLGLTRTGNRSCRMRFQLDKCMEWLERREN